LQAIVSICSFQHVNAAAGSVDPLHVEQERNYLDTTTGSQDTFVGRQAAISKCPLQTWEILETLGSSDVLSDA
jgi:hypothetical protein